MFSDPDSFSTTFHINHEYLICFGACITHTISLRFFHLCFRKRPTNLGLANKTKNCFGFCEGIGISSWRLWAHSHSYLLCFQLSGQASSFSVLILFLLLLPGHPKIIHHDIKASNILLWGILCFLWFTFFSINILPHGPVIVPWITLDETSRQTWPGHP